MKYTQLGRSGLEVSRICIGTLTFASPNVRPFFLDEPSSRPIIKRALDLGINFFDTADLYSNGISEEILGRALGDFASRDDVVIATKVGGPMKPGGNHEGLSKKHILHAVDASLKRLGTDYIDLYQFHRLDGKTPFEETLEAMSDVVRAGKVRYIGASTCHAYQFSKLRSLAKNMGVPNFVSMQNFYNLAYREEEREMIPYCREEGVGLLAWSPLARGILAGNRAPNGKETLRAETDDRIQKWFDDHSFNIAARVVKVAKDKNCAPAQVALAWLLGTPGLTAPIVGVTSETQVEQAAQSVDISLTAEERAYLEEVYIPRWPQAMTLQPRNTSEAAMMGDQA